MENNKKKILILTGPAGAGKTTIADLLVDRCGFLKVNGDALDKEFFPDGGHGLPGISERLKKSHDKIFAAAKEVFRGSENDIVVDYIIFDNYLDFFGRFKQEFGDNLEIKVLFPTEEEMIRRDRERECWTVGPDRILAVRAQFEAIKELIAENSFVDTTGQTPDATLEKHFNHYFFKNTCI